MIETMHSLQALVFSSVDVDMMRTFLVTSLVVSFVMYARFRMITGGTLTPAWIVLLILDQRWEALIATVAVAFAVVVIMRSVVLHRWAVSKSWQAALTVLTGVVLTGVMSGFTSLNAGNQVSSELDFLIVVGLFLTPGLIAYDFIRQGIGKTIAAIAIVATIAIAVSVPVVLLVSQALQGGSAVVITGQGRIPDDLWWLGVFVAVALSLMLKLGMSWRAGGFLTGLFAYEALTVETLAIAFGLSLLTFMLVRLFGRWVVLTPRLRFQVSLIVGSLIAWIALYWFTQLNFVPAIVANGYPLEPLIIVGLIASDLGRRDSSILTTFFAVVIVTCGVGGAIYIAQSFDIGGLIVVMAIAIALGLWFTRQNRVFSEEIQPAIALGRAVGAGMPPLGITGRKENSHPSVP